MNVVIDTSVLVSAILKDRTPEEFILFVIKQYRKPDNREHPAEQVSLTIHTYPPGAASCGEVAPTSCRRVDIW